MNKQLKRILILGAMGWGASSQAEMPSDFMQALKNAGTQAKEELAAGSRKESTYLQGTWTYMFRGCVSTLSQDAIKHPTEIFDISNYYGIFHFHGSKERGNILNADKKNQRCTTQAEAVYNAIPVSLAIPGSSLEVTEVFSSKAVFREKVNCAPDYLGPKISGTISVIPQDQDTAIFFAVPGLLIGTPVNCKNPKDYNIDIVKRLKPLDPSGG